MPKSKKTQSSKLRPYFTERNFTIILLIILVACAAVIITSGTTGPTELAEPVNVEQATPPEETE